MKIITQQKKFHVALVCLRVFRLGFRSKRTDFPSGDYWVIRKLETYNRRMMQWLDAVWKQFVDCYRFCSMEAWFITISFSSCRPIIKLSIQNLKEHLTAELLRGAVPFVKGFFYSLTHRTVKAYLSLTLSSTIEDKRWCSGWMQCGSSLCKQFVECYRFCSMAARLIIKASIQ